MNIPRSIQVSGILITVVALVTLIGPYAADWNETHIHNPNWPPHAKFHNAQTMLLGSLLAISALFYTWRSSSNLTNKVNNLLAATLLSSLYWISQAFSILYPETGFTDPEFGEIPKFMGIPAQLLFDIPLLTVLFVAYYLLNKTRHYVDN